MLDTIENRASSLGGLGSPLFRSVLPWPSGAINKPQRAHLSGSYAFDTSSVSNAMLYSFEYASYTPGSFEGEAYFTGSFEIATYTPGTIEGAAYLAGSFEVASYTPGTTEGTNF